MRILLLASGEPTPAGEMTDPMKVSQFEVIHFTEALEDGKHREVILIYALAAGTIYEFSGGKWIAIPINDSTIRLPSANGPKPTAPDQ
jgi:hypothetical protein